MRSPYLTATKKIYAMFDAGFTMALPKDQEAPETRLASPVVASYYQCSDLRWGYHGIPATSP